jgi:hypothetical protein
MAYYIYYRNTNGRLCSTINSRPITSINISIGYEDDGESIIYKSVPCRFIDLSIYNK